MALIGLIFNETSIGWDCSTSYSQEFHWQNLTLEVRSVDGFAETDQGVLTSSAVLPLVATWLQCVHQP